MITFLYVQGYTLCLSVKFKGFKNYRTLWVDSLGTVTRYRFEKYRECIPNLNKDAIINYLEEIGSHTVSCDGGCEALFKHPVERGSYKFQRREKYDSLWIEDWKVDYINIKAYAKCKFKKEIEVVWKTEPVWYWTCEFNLDTSKDKNFRVEISDDEDKVLVDSTITLPKDLRFIYQGNKFLRLCRAYIYGHLTLRKLQDFMSKHSSRGVVQKVKEIDQTNHLFNLI